MSGLSGQPVAIVGAGQIVEFAHLPAHRALGVPVVGIWARDPARAAALAAQAPGARACASLDDYPNPVPHVVEAIDYEEGRWQVVESERAWIPDGFRGPIVELVRAIEQEREPSVSGADNLHTLALVEAVYRSSETLRTVALCFE